MKNKITLVLSILFGLMMVNSGLNKFFHYMPMPETTPEAGAAFGGLMQAVWVLPLVALVEVVGGILMAIPKTRALGALIILPVTVGIVIHHLTLDVAGLGVGFVLFLINIWVIIENRAKYLPMIK